MSCLLLPHHAGRIRLRVGATKQATARETSRPMKDALRIPVLEDDDNDVELVRRCLSQEIPGVVVDEWPKALFGVMIDVREHRRAEAFLEGQVSALLREYCISRRACSNDSLEPPGRCRAADRNYSVHALPSAPYLRFRI